jgi:hypothetical protein
MIEATALAKFRYSFSGNPPPTRQDAISILERIQQTRRAGHRHQEC